MRWIIGDIHGMRRPLEALLAAVARRDSAAQLIFVGDYINRGPDSRGVIDVLLSLSGAVFLRGNHDDVFDLILHNECYMCHQEAPTAEAAFSWFLQHGLDTTLISYGSDWAEIQWAGEHSSPENIRRLTDSVPQAHRDFFRGLRPFLEHRDLFVAHAYWDIDVSDQSPSIGELLASSPVLRYRLLWGRFTDLQIRHKKAWTRPGYFGHTPVVNYRSAGGEFHPVRGPKIVLLDTAIALSPEGRLTAVCADAPIALQADRSGAILELS